MRKPGPEDGLAAACGGVRARRAVRVHAPERMEDFVTESDWELLASVIHLARERGIPFAISGGFATSFYSAVWRNTKDLDFCILPRDRDAMVQVTIDAGMHDLHEEKPYDRGWIYRATDRGIIADVIWQLANYRGQVDEGWLESGPEVTIHGDKVRLVPPEEMIWSKIYVVQRERCDFPDIINILYACDAEIDWSCLLERLDGEERLLASVISLFAWLAPGRAANIPGFVWQRLSLPRPVEMLERDEDRIRGLDSRPWFCPIPPA